MIRCARVSILEMTLPASERASERVSERASESKRERERARARARERERERGCTPPPLGSRVCVDVRHSEDALPTSESMCETYRETQRGVSQIETERDRER